MANSDRISTLLDPASLTALSAMNHLVPIANDLDQAWENMEMIADAIDVVVALIENNQMSDETGKAATVDYLLKMLNSPCEEVVKLALSGLDRIVFKNEVAVYAVRIGAFDYLANLITRTGDGQYEKLKSSDVLAFLMAPPENKYLKTSALNHKVFDEHLRMVLKGNEKEKERGLQFLWCITHNCKEAQEKVITKPELFPIILQAIADADCGRNALRLLHNLSKSDNAKKKLPVKEISSLVKPIMNIPDHIISKKDKAITALTVANLLEGGITVDSVIVEYLRDMVYELVQASFYSSKFTLVEVIACFTNLASKEENKVILSDCKLIKTLIDIIRLKEVPEKIIGKGYTLSNVKENAAKTLWYLAYSETIQKRMREDGGGLEDLKSLFNEIQEEKLKKNIKDVLWIFELKDANQKMSNLKSSAGNISKAPSTPVLTTKSLSSSPTSSPSPTAATSPSPTPPESKSYNYPKATPSPTSTSSPSSAPPSYKPPSAASASSPSSTPPSYKPPSAASMSSAPSYKPPTPSSVSKPPTYTPPTPASSSAASKMPELRLDTSTSSRSAISPSPSPVPQQSPSASPSPSPIPGSSPRASPIPSSQGESNGSYSANNTVKTSTLSPTSASGSPKYGGGSGTKPPTTSSSSPTASSTPKWMVGGNRASPSPTPSSTPSTPTATTPTTPPLSSPTTAASISSSGNKPKWFVSGKK